MADGLAAYAAGLGVTFTAALLERVAKWLTDVPELNSVLKDGDWRPLPRVDLGVALSHSPNVLLVPTLRDCGTWTCGDFAAALAGLRSKAERDEFVISDFAPAGFTVSNLGPWRVDAFTSIVRAPQTAILSVAAARTRPVVASDGLITSAKVCSLTLGVDHRVMDGAFAAAALGVLADSLEAPSC